MRLMPGSARIDDIRADVRSLEASQRRSMENIETRLTHRIDGLEARVGQLEQEDKNFLKSSSKAGGVSGGVVGA
ncbi:MAG: hypothetical protein LBU76_03330, partial [Azoarcus sp.]|nr:hypothetical protein [Azoarcus sp.]